MRVSENLQRQASWWSAALKAAVHHCPIVHPDQGVPSNAVKVWSDAAGGTPTHMGAGLGAVA